MLLRPGMLPCKLQFLRLLPRRRRLGNERVKLSANTMAKHLKPPDSRSGMWFCKEELNNSPSLETGFKHQFVY